MLQRILSFVAMFMLCYMLVLLVQYVTSGWAGTVGLYSVNMAIAAALAAILSGLDFR
jgi:hypothetical protein